MSLQHLLLRQPSSEEDADRQARDFLGVCDAALTDFMSVSSQRQPAACRLSAHFWREWVAQARAILGDQAVRRALAHYG